MPPFQGLSSLQRNQTASDSFDEAGSNEPARNKSIPCINATNLLKQQMKHGFYVKYLGENA